MKYDIKMIISAFRQKADVKVDIIYRTTGVDLVIGGKELPSLVKIQTISLLEIEELSKSKSNCQFFYFKKEDEEAFAINFIGGDLKGNFATQPKIAGVGEFSGSDADGSDS